MNAVDPTLTDLDTLTINDAYNDAQAWMDTRFRLKFSAKANDYATGVISFEGDSSQWGEDPDGRNTAGAWNADRNAVEVKQFYIDFKVPGLSDFAPSTVRAGIQGFSVRSHVLLYVDGAGVETTTTAGPVKFQFYWYKPEEGDTHRSRDTDMYGARLWVPGVMPVTPGGYILYWNGNNYPRLNATDDASADLYWVGFYVDGKIGPVALKTDFVYSGGEVEPRSAQKALGVQDVDAGGWLFFADACASIPMDEMGLEVGGTFMYATGNDATDNDFDGYFIPPGSEEAYGGNWGVVFYPSRVNDAVRIANTGSGTLAGYGKAGGTWFAKIYAGVKPVDWLKVHLYGMYIGDTSDNWDTHGNALTSTAALEDEDVIGIELGGIVDFQIYKNLTYSIGAGYLFAGDALDQFDLATTIATGVITNDEPDNPWAVLSQLIFKF
jgi:hypothetical protein